jgi:hypothetical protein
MKFIQFGCWNEINFGEKCEIGGKNPISKVMNALSHHTLNPETDFIIVSGDNYYPDKQFPNDDGSKTKIIRPRNIELGLNCLPKNIPIKMILGNHDLESDNDKLFMEDADITNPRHGIRETVTGDPTCFILKNELDFINEESSNIEYDFFFFKYDEESKTLLLLIDTSIYDDKDVGDMLPCYKYIFDGETKTRIDILELQKLLIKNVITAYKHKMKRIIISGHHPITGFKFKKEKTDKDKKSKDKTEKDLKEKDKTAKDKTSNLLITPFPLFIEQLKEIYRLSSDVAVEYYYLCADLHLYQQGTVVIALDMNPQVMNPQVMVPKNMIIKQYIVGTGGTALDPQISFDANETYKTTNGDVTYLMTPEDIDISLKNYGHGFIECTLRATSLPLFKFFKATEGYTLKKGGKKTYKKSYKRLYNKKTYRR